MNKMYQSIKYLLFSFCALFAFALTLSSCGSDDDLKGFSKDDETVIVGSNGNHFTIQLGKNRADKDYYYFEIPKTSNGTEIDLTVAGDWKVEYSNKIADHGTGTVFERGSKLYVQLTNKNNIKIEYNLIYNNGGTTLSGEYKGKTTTNSSFNFSFQ